MPVQAPEEHLFIVEVKPVGVKLRRTEAKTHVPGIQHFALSVQQLHPAGIKVRVLQ